MDYKKQNWIDHIEDAETGEVFQEGTLFTAKRMNYIEEGIYQANSEIKEKANFSDMKYSYLDNDSLICVTYDNGNPQKYKLMISFDGINYNKIDDLDLYGWDYCLAYNDNAYYLAFDYMSEGFDPDIYPHWVGANKIALLKTTDFKTFEKIEIELPQTMVQAFAPEIMIENGTMHLFFSASDLSQIETDIDSNVQYVKYTYYMKSTNLGLTWTTPQKINFFKTDGTTADTGNKIDPAIYYKDGVYHIFIKNETEKYIEQFTSSTINGDYTLKNTINKKIYVEAPAIILFGGVYYLYADCYGDGKYIYYTSSDLNTWSNPSFIVTGDDSVMRHFSPIKTVDSTLLKDIVARNGYDPLVDNSKFKNSKNINVVSDLYETNYTSLKIQANTIYRLTGPHDCTINLIDVSNLKLNDTCYFLVASDVATLIIKNNSTGLYLPASEIKLGKTTKSNNILIELRCIDIMPHTCFINCQDFADYYDSVQTIQSNTLTDTATGINGVFFKRNKIVHATFVTKLTKAMDVGLYTMSFTAPYKPITDVYNVCFQGYNENGDLQFRSAKINSSGTIELRTTTPIKTGEYFECSVTYIEQ